VPEAYAEAGPDTIPAEPAEPPEPTMPVASVARRLGVAPSTLRTWDRRYGLGPSKHTDGRHRRYGAADIDRLELMQRALLRGASTAEAARYALEQVPKSALPQAAPPPPPTSATPAEAPRYALGEEPAVLPAEPAAIASVHIETPDGDLVLDAEEAASDREGPSRQARRLSTAAQAMDVGAVQRVLAEVIDRYGVLDAWGSVLQPVLTALGARWRGSRAGAEVEYLLAECVFSALVRATPVLPEPRNHRPVLLGCVPDERDSLSLYALAACLADRRIGAQLFGVPLPLDVLAVAIRRSAPAAVVLWAQRREVADPRLFDRVSRGRQRSRLFACGPGWDTASLPGRVELLETLPDAVDRLEYVLLGAR
jgi:DNA-binding transcriptional MerR regulator